MDLESTMMPEIARFANVLNVGCERKKGFRHHSWDNSSSFTSCFSTRSPQRSLSPIIVRIPVFNQHKIALAILSRKGCWLLEGEWLAHKVNGKSSEVYELEK